MRRMCRETLLLLVVLAAAPWSAGDLMWVEPDPGLPQPGETVRLNLGRGDFFVTTSPAQDVGEVDRYQRIWNDGRADLMTDTGNPESARFRVAEAGTQLVILSTKSTSSARRAGRATYYCKAFVIAGSREGSEQLHLSEVGQRLEIVPQTDPAAFAQRGGVLEIQLLFEREPLAGVVVKATRRDTGREAAQQAVTDEIGLARLRLDRAGDWLVSVEYSVRCEGCEAGSSERLVGTLFLRSGGA